MLRKDAEPGEEGGHGFTGHARRPRRQAPEKPG
jgi:hypothetical protein